MRCVMSKAQVANYNTGKDECGTQQLLEIKTGAGEGGDAKCGVSPLAFGPQEYEATKTQCPGKKRLGVLIRKTAVIQGVYCCTL